MIYIIKVYHHSIYYYLLLYEFQCFYFVSCFNAVHDTLFVFNAICSIQCFLFLHVQV